MKQIEEDPVIDEIREVRHQISERFGHDPSRLVAYYMELQKKYQERLVPPRDVEVSERTGSKTP